jgi:hypothetical protein
MPRLVAPTYVICGPIANPYDHFSVALICARCNRRVIMCVIS